MSIVQDDKMAGEPRLEGRRITVLTVVNFVEDFGGVAEAARELSIPESEVREALEYAESHPDQMEALRSEWEELASDLEEDAPV